MQAEVVVLNYSSFSHPEVVEFCKSWQHLSGKVVTIYSPMSAKFKPVALVLSDALPETVFGLSGDLAQISVVYFMPATRYQTWPAVELLLLEIKEKARSLTTAELFPTISGNIRVGNIRIYNSIYL